MQAHCDLLAGMEDGERPWLKPFVHTPAARDPEPGHTRKRPLIYVYELPPWYNSVMLQVRALLARLPTPTQREGRPLCGRVLHPRLDACNACRFPPASPALCTLPCRCSTDIAGLPISPPYMQYRVERGDCVHRVFDDHNSSLRNDGWLYLDTCACLGRRAGAEAAQPVVSDPQASRLPQACAGGSRPPRLPHTHTSCPRVCRPPAPPPPPLQ